MRTKDTNEAWPSIASCKTEILCADTEFGKIATPEQDASCSILAASMKGNLSFAHYHHMRFARSLTVIVGRRAGAVVVVIVCKQNMPISAQVT